MCLCYDMFYILWFSPKKDLWNVNKLWLSKSENLHFPPPWKSFIFPKRGIWLIYIYIYVWFTRSRGSSGSIVSDYGLDDRAIEVRSPTGAEDFSPSPCVQTGSGPTQPPIQWIPGVLSPGLKRGRCVTVTTHPHLVPRLRMSRSCTSSPPSASMACCGTALLYFILFTRMYIWNSIVVMSFSAIYWEVHLWFLGKWDLFFFCSDLATLSPWWNPSRWQQNSW
jgi:hypothetical protein